MATAVLAERARAKVNLTLQVRGRRLDGYHDLDSLVAFAHFGDDLTFEPGGSDFHLVVRGPTAREAGPLDDNLVLRAARAFRDAYGAPEGGLFRVTKRIPAAAGLGGGSADAAATLRLLARHHEASIADARVVAIARALGADVPVCLESRTRRMAGVGHELGEPITAPPLAALLVNPGVESPTGPVFAALGLKPGEVRRAASDAGGSSPDPGSAKALIAGLRADVNDLEAPAIRLQPVIAEVLEALRADPACLLARMSGSGATCFALYPSCRAAARGQARLRRLHPTWWTKTTLIGGQ